MANLSQKKRERMMAFLDRIRQEHKNDDDVLIAINEIEGEITDKKYGLVWERHEEAVDVMMRENIPVFTECKEREISALPDDKYNFILEGDNLHSLRLLQKTHSGVIDIIYIDPPYNGDSGKGKISKKKSRFIYDNRIVDTNDTFRHSKWISFMAERLFIAKDLLKDSGLLFISIDDNEQATLKLLCDDIFGSDNFINMFVWQRNSSAKTEKGKFTINTEYILLYAKTKKYVLNDAYKPLSNASMKLFKYDDNDGRGKYQTVSLQKPRDPGPETTYDYIDETGKIWPCPPKGWRMKYDKIKALELDGRLILTGKVLREKDYWDERENEGKRIDTLWNDLPQNSAGSGELETVMGKPDTFDNPKPTGLISRCLNISHKNAVVLDFFAGSGTTGHAVMKLNTEDGGKRQFILCTKNENEICEKVTYERIRRVINGYGQTIGIPANVKYFRTEFIPKDAENITSELLNHIAEMVELEHGIKIDGRRYVIVLSDEELDQITSNLSSYKKLKKMYVTSQVFFTAEQKRKLGRVEIITIPDYYFINEMQEAGEL